ncbi:MAG: SUMF1/EgtB/PvdO family nonheme iron enzyme, partial [Gemmataceae bacterium]
MSDGAILQEAIRRQPGDGLAWLALADWLEESGQPTRAGLLRLWLRVRAMPWADAARKPEKEIARLLRAGVRPAVPRVVNSLGMEFALVPPGVFQLGSATSDQGDEKPPTEVEMASPYYVGVSPVTQRQYRKLTRQTPSVFRAGAARAAAVAGGQTDDFPADSVSWTRAAAFCARLSARAEEKAAGRTYRLPTEAEWAYAARSAGACSTAFLFANSLSSDDANFNGGSPFPGNAPKGPALQRPCPVGLYPPNALGLLDVIGNVWEW